jgi:hypothetical protein
MRASIVEALCRGERYQYILGRKAIPSWVSNMSEFVPRPWRQRNFMAPSEGKLQNLSTFSNALTPEFLQ